jgi:hypothetical protein
MFLGLFCSRAVPTLGPQSPPKSSVEIIGISGFVLLARVIFDPSCADTRKAF